MDITSRLPKSLHGFAWMLEEYSDERPYGCGVWAYLLVGSETAENISADHALHEDRITDIRRLLVLVRREYERKGYAEQMDGEWRFRMDAIPAELL